MAPGSMTMCQRIPVLPDRIGCVVATLGMIASRFLRAALRLLNIPKGVLCRGTATGELVGWMVSDIITLHFYGDDISAAGLFAMFHTQLHALVRSCIAVLNLWGGLRCYVGFLVDC
jgi:hypothetical protein